MALESLIMKVRCQFIFLSIFIFLLLFCNIVKDIYLFTYLFIYLFCFSFKTLPEPYKPLQDNKTHRMPRLIFTHHIFIPFNDFNFFCSFYRGMILFTPHSFVTMKATTMKLAVCRFFARRPASIHFKTSNNSLW